MPIQEKCWNCFYFYRKNPTVNNTGECRRHAPMSYNDALQIAGWPFYLYQFARIDDGNVIRCGEFKPEVGDIPDPN